MTIQLGNGASGEEFAFDSDQASAAGAKISAFAESLRGLPRSAGTQDGPPSLGSDRVSKAVAEVIGSQNALIAAGSAHLSGRLDAASAHFSFSVAEVDKTESDNARSLTVDLSAGA